MFDYDINCSFIEHFWFFNFDTIFLQKLTFKYQYVNMCASLRLQRIFGCAKNINRFDDICWYFPLYLIFIVWLRFVNHLLNYYLLTYLLLPNVIKINERIQLSALLTTFKTIIIIIMRPSSLGGGRILRRTLSVCPSVCPSVACVPFWSVTWRHLANYNDTLRAA